MAINFSDTSSTETKLLNDDVILQESAQGLSFEIPLGSFIFNADYARDGQDLVLSDDLGREVVIDGYFTMDQLPAISNEFGASVEGSFVAKLAGPGQVAQSGAATSSLGEPVGAVEAIEGNATVRHTDGTSEPLLIGDEIYKDDIIETASDGTLGILMEDGSVIGVGPGSRMTIDNFVYDASSSEGSLGLSFLKGAVSFVSGKIAKNDYDDVDIKVPFGSIGIRGTEFVVEIGDDGIATVSVIQGAVAATVGGTEVVLNPGELISLAAAGLSTVETISVEAIRAKHSGVLDAQKKTQVIKEGRDEEGGGDEPAAGSASGDQPVNDAPVVPGDNSDDTPAPADQTNTVDETIPELTVVEISLDSEIVDGVDVSAGLTDTGVGSNDGGDEGDDGESGNNPQPEPNRNFTGTEFDDTHNGGASNDDISGAQGNDTLTGEGGNDSVTGGEGNDSLSGGGGDDTVDGGAGNDFIEGGEGSADILLGGSGDDVIYGDDAADPDPTTGDNDTLYGDAGADSLYGGGGDDDLLGGDDDDLLHGGSGADILEGNEGADNLYGDADDDVLLGGDGDDLLHGGSDSDILEGNDGADSLYGDADNDVLLGGANEDLLLGGSGDDALDGGEGNDSLNGESGADTVDGGFGNDLIEGGEGGGDDILLGGSGDDVIYGDDAADPDPTTGDADTLYGEAGADSLYGGGGDDVLLGGDQDDLLHGGSGGDVLDGGSGTDVAVYDGDVSDYVVSITNGKFYILETSTGDVDQLENIEQVSFNDGTFSFAAFDISGSAAIDEGSSGSYTVTLAGTTLQTGQTASVDISLNDVDTDGADFADFAAAVQSAADSTTGVSFDGLNTLTFSGGPGNATELDFSLGLELDDLLEGSENFQIVLSSPGGTGPLGNEVLAVLDGGTAETTVSDTTAANVSWTLVENSDPVSEGTNASYTIEFTGVDLAAGHSVSIDLSFIAGTAGVADFDETLSQDLIDAASGVTGVTVSGTTVTFDDTALSSFTFTLPTTSDGLVEGDETFSLQISNPEVDGAPNGSGTDTVETTISDGVVFSISGTTSVAEGATASYTLAYAGALPDGESVTIDLTLDETDTTSGDYSDFVAALTTAAGSTTGVTFDGVDTVTFTAGIGNSLTLDFDLAMTTDGDAEGSEDFSITLSDPTSSLGPIPAVDAAAADVTTNIIDGDTIEFSITGGTIVTESGTSNYVISYSGTLQAGETVSVVVSLADDAIDGTTSADYEDFLTALSDAAAAGPSGVTASGNILTFDSTVSVLSLNLDMVSDTFIEGDEGFSVSLSGPISATGVDVTVDGGANSVSTTLNDESAGAVSWTLTENVDPVQEGDAASYTIDFSGASLVAGHTVSIDVSLLPGTAGASDFTDSLSQDLIDAASGVMGVSVSGTTVTFTDTASSTFTFTLPTSVDGLSEGSENFSIQISSPQVDGASDGSISGPDTVETQLVDSAADIITFSLTGDAGVSEGAAGTYTVSYAGTIQAGQTASVILGLTDGETTSGDYSTLIAALTTAVGAVSGVTFDGTDTLTFDDTATALSFDIDATVDSIAEGDESFSVTLDDSSSATGLSTAIDAGADTVVTTITDGDVIEFSITGDSSVAEGSSASYLIGYSGTLQAGETASVDVSLAEDGASPADFEDFLTALGDALTAGVTLSGNTLTFDSSATSLSLSLDTIADSLVEGPEDFNIFLSNDTAPNVATSIDGANSNVGTTINDGNVVEFSLTGDTGVLEGLAATYTISMTGDLPLGVTTSVNVALANVDTTSSDYGNLLTALSDAAAITSGVSVSGATVTFDGTTSAFSFDLSAIGGDLVEGPEQFNVSIDTPTISNFGSAVLAAAQQVDTTITDADSLTVSFSEATLSRNEGLNASYSIVLAGLAVALTALPAAASVSFDLELDLGSADAADITGVLSDALGLLPSGVSVSGSGNTVTITVSDTAPFLLGEISLDFVLPLVGSDGTEADEDYTLTISNVMGTGVDAAVVTAINTTTIVDDGAVSTSPTENADNITGTSGADNINALGGDDTVDGGNGGDTILGGAGNDYLFGNDGFDNLQGGADNDTLEGGEGNDTLSGGAGDDVLRGQGWTNTLNGGAGDDYLEAAEGSKLYGDADNDTLIGGFGTESMDGGTGNDSLEGRELNDTLLGGDGADILRGGTEDDSLDGGDGADSLFGDADMDTLLGGADNDTLDGGTGNDSLDGQADDDTVMGGDGDDTLLGGTGSNRLEGGNDNDTYLLNLGDGDHTVADTSGVDRIIIEDLGDFARSGASDLTFTQDDGSSLTVEDLYGASSVSIIEFTTVTGTHTFDLHKTLSGDADNDLIVGSDGLADVIDGGDGNDLLFGDGGNDTLTGGAGDDVLIGEAGDDSLDGGDGYDQAFFDNVSVGITATFSAVTTVTGDAGVGSDTLVDVEKIRGSEYNDTLTADGTYSGTYGDFNVFEGGDGDDSITGNGNTRVEYSNADGGVLVDLADGYADAGGLGATNIGLDTLVGGINRISGSHFGDSLTGGVDDDFETFRGLGGDDTIDGSTGYDEADYWHSTEGITAIMTAGSAGTVSKASGELDTLISIEKIQGSNFSDSFDASAFVGAPYESFNAFEGLDGNDTVVGNNETRIEYRDADGGVHVDLASGFSQGMAGIGGATNVGNDTISGVNSIIGSSHDDSLVGGAIDDYEEYRPGAGDDTIDGGTGFDRLRYTHSDSAITIEFSDVTDESGTVSIDGFGGSDVFTNIDEVQGSSFGDSMTGNSQTDRFIGGAGDDTIDGGSNYDLARYDRGDQTSGVHVDLFDGFAHNDGYGDTDSLIGIEEIRGGSMNDSLYGSDEYEKFIGNGGDDDLQGRDGRDTLLGGDGNDTLSGGDDWDTLEGGDGVDNLDGGTGNDSLDGQADDDTVMGGAGDDTLLGGTGSNRLEGGNDNDTYLLNLGDGDHTVADTAGVDRVIIEDLGDFTRSGASDLTFTQDDGSSLTVEDLYGASSVSIIEFSTATGTHTFDLHKTLTGDADNDLIVGSDGLADVIDGGDGNDLLFGDGGNDTISGGAGDDVLIGEAGDDSLDGGEGYDHAFFDNVSTGITATFSAVTTVTGDAGIGTDTLVDVEKIRGSEFNDTLTADGTYSGTYGNFNVFEGGDGDDSITGNGNTRVEYLNADGGVVVDLAAGTANAGGLGATNVGSDTLVGGINRIAGSHFGDSLTGGADDDIESFRGMDGNDTIDGSTGYDESDYWLSSEGVTATLTTGGLGTVSKASGELDTLISIEKIRGSEFADSFDASAFDGGSYGLFNVFEGLDGNDTVVGNGETRVEYREADGGVHVDLAAGTSQGTAAFDGATNVGTDTITGANSIVGSAFNDSLVGGAIDDYEEYRPGAGDDTIDGGTGFDRLRYTYSDSAITMEFSDVTDESGTVSIDGFGGSDVFINIDEVQGSSFGDSMTGNSQTDRFIGGAGDDTIDGGSNYDLARYDRSDQTFGVHVDLFDGFAHDDGYGDTDSLIGIEEIRGGSMNDSLYGSDEYEKFIGNDGNDDLQGRDGRDTLEGGDGNDTLSGGDDWDTLEGGDGVDSLDGGAGSDWLNGGAGDDFIDGGADSDGVNYYTETVGINVSMSSAGAGTVTHDGYTDTLINIERIHGSYHADFFTGSSDADRFYGEDGDDTMDGGAGDDFMQAGDGANSLEGGLGNDTADYYSVSTGVTAVMTGGGAGTVLHDGDTDTLGGIEYVGGSYADDSLTGSADVDSFTGHSGNDTLIGNGGEDWLFGGAGQDVMTGGTGIDTFYISEIEDATIVALNGVFSDSSDVITDFVSATDIIFLYSNFAFSGSYDAADDFLTTIGGSAYDGTNADYTGGQDTGEAKLIFDGSYLYYDDNESADGYTVIAEFTSGTIVGTDVSAT